jgi:hypothetical protein
MILIINPGMALALPEVDKFWELIRSPMMTDL